MNVSHSNYTGATPQFSGLNIKGFFGKFRRNKNAEAPIEPSINSSTKAQNRDRIELNTNTAAFQANVDTMAAALLPALTTFESIDPSQSSISGADVIKTLVMATKELDKKYSAALTDFTAGNDRLNYNKLLGSKALFRLKAKLTGDTPKEPVNPEGWIKLSWLEENYHTSQADALEKVLDAFQNNNVTNFRISGEGDNRYGEIRLAKYVIEAVDQIIKEQKK